MPESLGPDAGTLGELHTWALPVEPDQVDDTECQQLADHRLAYLGYEGPISGYCGSVTRWDEGKYTVIERGTQLLCVELRGGRLAEFCCW